MRARLAVSLLVAGCQWTLGIEDPTLASGDGGGGGGADAALDGSRGDGVADGDSTLWVIEDFEDGAIDPLLIRLESNGSLALTGTPAQGAQALEVQTPSVPGNQRIEAGVRLDQGSEVAQLRTWIYITPSTLFTVIGRADRQFGMPVELRLIGNHELIVVDGTAPAEYTGIIVAPDTWQCLIWSLDARAQTTNVTLGALSAPRPLASTEPFSGFFAGQYVGLTVGTREPQSIWLDDLAWGSGGVACGP